MKRQIISDPQQSETRTFRRRRRLLPNCELPHSAYDHSASIAATGAIAYSVDNRENHPSQFNGSRRETSHVCPDLDTAEDREQLSQGDMTQDNITPHIEDENDEEWENVFQNFEEDHEHNWESSDRYRNDEQDEGEPAEEVGDQTENGEQVTDEEKDNVEDDADNEDTALLKHSKILLPWTKLYALLCVCGSVRLTVKQHEVFRRTLRWSHRGHCLPSYRTVRRVQFPFILEHCFPASRIYTFEKDDSAVNLEDDEGEEQQQLRSDGIEDDRNGDPITPPRSDVRIFFPTEWAKLDVITSPIYESLFRENDADRRGYSRRCWTLSSSNIIRKKKAFLDPANTLFVKSDDKVTIAHRGYTVRLTLSRFPESLHGDRHELGFAVEDEYRGRHKLQGSIVYTWCVKVSGQEGLNESSIPDNLTESQRGLLREIRYLDPGTNGSETKLISDKGLYPGDLCTLLEPISESQTEWHCVIVHRFCTLQDGKPSRILLWFRMNDTNRPRSWMIHEQQIHGVELTGTMAPQDDEEADTKDFGVLDTGEKYVVYRILLYTDDFQTSSDKVPNGSNGGCYILPVNLPPCDRRGRSAVRVISLTPPGVSSNKVLHAIIPDLVKGTVEGVKGFLPNGEKVRIFLDVLGYVGDYLGSCHVVDSMTHTANAPCTLCNFRRHRGSRTRASRYGYTVDVHSANSAAFRTGDRHQALREGGIDDETARRMGMAASSAVGDVSCPLIALQREMATHEGKERRNTDGRRIVTAAFDAYRSNIVAPDHLLTGLAKNILSLLLELTPAGQRSLLDIRICDELTRNGLLKQNTILKSDGKGLVAMSLSGIFCVLCVSGPVIRSMFEVWNITEGIRDRAVVLLDKLRELVAQTYWNPQVHIDGKRAVEALDEDGSRTFFEELQKKAVDYIQSVNKLCTISEIAGKHLDKPNLHRLLELYRHTVPAYGHANHVMELVFECAHQPLKRCITRGNHKRDHLSAVEHTVANDWQSRLMLLREEAEDPDQEKAQRARFGLRRLMIGESVLHVDTYSQDEEIFMQDIDRAIKEAFIDPVNFLLQLQCTPMRLRSQETVEWTGRWYSKMSRGKLPGFEDDEAKGEKLLKTMWDLYAFINPYGPPDVKRLRLFREMIRRKRTKSGELKTTGKEVDIVGVGDVVQVHIPEGEQEQPVITGSGEQGTVLAFYCVVGIIDDGNYGIVAGVLRCDEEDDFLHLETLVKGRTMRLLRMTDHVRRVAIVHACEKDATQNGNKCEIRDRDRSSSHNRTVIDGGKYYYINRRKGYPPRMA